MEWGTAQFPEILQHVRVTVWTNERCAETYANEEIHPFHICAGDVSWTWFLVKILVLMEVLTCSLDAMLAR